MSLAVSIPWNASDLRECLDHTFPGGSGKHMEQKVILKYGAHIRDFSVLGGCIMLDMRYHNHMHKTVQRVSADAAAAYSVSNFGCSSTSAYKKHDFFLSE